MKPLNKSFSILSFPKNNKKTNKQLSPTFVPINDLPIENSNISNNEKSSPQESSLDTLYPLENIPKITIPENETDENPSPLPKSQSATELRVPTVNKPIRSSSQSNILHSNSLNRHPNCLSMISPSDAVKASTVGAARKHSLPPVMDLFSGQKLSQPYMTLSEFKRVDEFPRQQRAILAALQRQDSRLRKEGVIKEMKKASLRGKRERKKSKAKEKEIINRSSMPMIRRSSTGVVSLKFFGIKKGKKRTTSGN